MENTKSQMSDQSLKGAILGLLSYFAMKADLDPAMIAMATPVIAAGLAYASTRVGDPGAASFLAKASAEAPEVISKVTAKPAKKAAAKSAPAKKAAPKK